MLRLTRITIPPSRGILKVNASSSPVRTASRVSVPAGMSPRLEGERNRLAGLPVGESA